MERGEWARRAAAFGYASRAKKPKMEELLQICGYEDRSEPVDIREEFAVLLAESNARVAAAEAAKKNHARAHR